MENNKHKKLEVIKRILIDVVPNEIRDVFFSNNDMTENQINSIISVPIGDKRMEGLDWPERAHTMIGMKRLNNIQFCVEDVIQNNIEGDFIETGVWRGGASIFIKYILDEYNIRNKKVFVADSFEGLPAPDNKFPEDNGDTHYKHEYLKVGIEEVIKNFVDYKVKDDNVIFLKGWFKDTLPTVQSNRFSVIRLDGDMYESTIQALENLYHKLSIGGYIIIDDFCLKNCVKAVNDFRTSNNIIEPIVVIDKCGVYWKKEK